jgi:apolipoprotein N-acyltransferase
VVQSVAQHASQKISMWTLGASLLAGVLHGFSMAWPAFAWGDALGITGQSYGTLQCLSLASLSALLLYTAEQESESTPGTANRRTRGRAGLRGMQIAGLYAASAMTATWGWLYVSMHQYGGLPSWLACLAVGVLALALSLYFALAGGVWVWLYRQWLLKARKHEGRYATHAKSFMMWSEFNLALAGAVLFAALWTLAELARGQWFTGFPWGAAGYAHGQSALAVYAPWVGVYGLSLMAAVLAMGVPLSLSILMAGRTRAWMGLLGVGVVGVALIPVLLQQMPASFTTSSGTMKVRLLQGNIPQDEKFIPGQGVQMALSWYGEQLLSNAEALVVTPETAIPVLPQQLSPAYLQALTHKYAGNSGVQSPAQLALIGLPMGGANVGYSNSVLALGQDNLKYRYDKQHLVPFGEFVPPFFQWFVRLMNIPLGDFGQQRSSASVLAWQGQRLLPQICYEDLFGEETAKYFAQEDLSLIHI